MNTPGSCDHLTVEEGRLFRDFKELKRHPDAIHFATTVPKEYASLPLYQHLSKKFASTIAHNDKSIPLSGFNVHDHKEGHMLAVANGAREIGRRIDISKERLKYVFLGAAFHDVGHEYPKDFLEGVASGKYAPEDFGKKAQDFHPQEGAYLVTNAIEEYLDEHGSDKERADWDDWARNLTHNVILYHSNGSEYQHVQDRLSEEEKLARLTDKDDNIAFRVHPSQTAAMQAVAKGMNRGEAIQATQFLETFEPEDLYVRGSSTHGRSPSDVFNSLENLAVNEKYYRVYQHQIAPYAITDQFMRMTPRYDFEMHYAVDTRRIESLLGIPFSKEQYLEIFDYAYGKSSMQRSAEVTYSIRSKFYGAGVVSTDPHFTVVFHFADGMKHVEQYKPRFN